ncbi:MAG: NAD(P)/FAD-dependent oxidoreductase [Cyanobacteria bacterium P01_F01_bin.86]
MSTSQSTTDVSATDVVILGAGPAGVTASLFLCQAKIPHTLVDKATFPRDKVDGNVYGNKVIEILNRLDPAYFSELMARTDQTVGCSWARVFTPNEKNFDLRFDAAHVKDANGQEHSETPASDTPFFTMNRRHFDHFLISKLDQNYVDQHFGSELVGLNWQASQWQITLKSSGQSKTIKARLIVAADGVNSTVLQLLGLSQPIERGYDTVQGYFRGVAGFQDDATQSSAVGDTSHIEGYFLPESNPGFLFITPLPEGLFSVGVGKPQQDIQNQHVDLQQLLHEAMHRHPKLSARFAQCESVSEIRPWPVMVGPSQPVSVSGAGYLITGDAAGLCNPLTCFGTGSAMVSGMLAAQQVQQSVSQQRFDGETLSAYDRALYGRLQREFRVSSFIKSLTKRDRLFNQLTNNQPIQGFLRRTLKGTSTMLKQL